MTTYLLTWNPNKWGWPTLGKDLNIYRRQNYIDERWSCGQTKRIHKGDRVFLLRQGKEPRGLVASGWARSDVFPDLHWDENSEAGSRTAQYVDVRFDVLLDADHEAIFQRTWLDSDPYNQVRWNSQMSGIVINEDVAMQLEIDWARLLASKRIVQSHASEKASVLPEEVQQSNTYVEGATHQIRVNVYERNSDARRRCIQHYGLNCAVCQFNFEEQYGDIGIGFRECTIAGVNGRSHAESCYTHRRCGRKGQDHGTQSRPATARCRAAIGGAHPTGTGWRDQYQ